MPRPVKPNKLPKTSISISEELWKLLNQNKKKRHTMDEYLRYIIADYYTIKEEFSFVEDAYNKASAKNAEYFQKLSELQNRLNNLENGNQVEPARGVAAKSNYPPNLAAPFPIPSSSADNLATNLPNDKNTEKEVTEKV